MIIKYNELTKRFQTGLEALEQYQFLKIGEGGKKLVATSGNEIVV